MSAKPKTLQKKPGRPKKVPLIQTSDFRGILKEKPVGYDLEFKYTEPAELKKFMNTFDSCGVKEMVIHFTPNRIRIHGYVSKNNTSVNQIPTGCDDALKLIIMPHKTYSYFSATTFYLRFKMTEWEAPLVDVDESCNMVTMRYIARNNVLLFEASNVTVGCTFKHSIHIDGVLTEDVNTINSKMSATVKNSGIIFENVLCNNLKKILSKPPRKKSTGARIENRPHERKIAIIFPIDDKNSEMLLPALSEAENKAQKESGRLIKEEIQVIVRTDVISNCAFPSAEIAKFMVHMKDAGAVMYFAKESMLIKIVGSSSKFNYYKEFS